MICNRHSLRSILILLLIYGCRTNGASTNHVIINVHIVDVVAGELRKADDAVLISDGTITKIGTTSEILGLAKSLENTKVIDGQGGYLIPGLFDLHIHNRADTEEVMQLYLLNGITTVRNMNGSDGGKDHVSISRQIAAGSLLGPRYFSSSPFIIESIEKSEVDEFVRRCKLDGFHGIKIHGNIARDAYERIIEFADSIDFPVYGHAQRDKELELSLKMREITHLEEFVYLIADTLRTPEYLNNVVQKVKQSKIWICPTVKIYAQHIDYFKHSFLDSLSRIPFIDYVDESQYIRYSGARNPYRRNLSNRQLYAYIATHYGVELNSPEEAADFATQRANKNFDLMKWLLIRMVEEDIPLITGADSFGLLPNGFGLHLELALWQEIGIAPSKILKAATYNSSQFMELDVGEIIEGNVADLVLLEENPLTDITATQSIQGIFYDGNYLDASYIQSGLEKLKKRNIEIGGNE